MVLKGLRYMCFTIVITRTAKGLQGIVKFLYNLSAPICIHYFEVVEKNKYKFVIYILYNYVYVICVNTEFYR